MAREVAEREETESDGAPPNRPPAGHAGPAGGPGMGGRRDTTGLLQLNKTFVALSIPAYRLLWGSMLFGFLGMQMQMVARGLLAYQIGGTNSAIAIVSLGWGVPMLLFGLVGGTFADKFSRRKVMIISQGATASIAVVVALLVQFEYINLLYLFASGLAQGTVFAFAGPSRQAYMTEVVGEKQLLNAIALNSAGMNLTRIVGPSLAGALVAVPFVDITGVFFIQAAMNLAAVGLLLLLPFFRGVEPETAADGEAAAAQPNMWRNQRRNDRSVMSELVDGLRYVVASPILLTLLLMGLVPSLLGMAYQTFLPVFAQDVFGNGIDRNAQGLGLMMTVTGIGALAGSLVVASMQDYPRRTQLQLFAGLGFGLSLAFFAVQGNFILAIVGLIGIGFSANFFQALNSTMVMTASDPQYYGRVMSVNMMTFALMPIGTLPVGVIADVIGSVSSGIVTLEGIQVALLGCGLIIAAFILLVTLKNPAYRRLEQDDFKHFATMAAERVEADRAGGSVWQQMRRAASHERGSSMARNLEPTATNSDGS